MSRQYRVLELTSPVNTFTPQYSDNGTTWNTISQTTCLTKAAADQVIEKFISSGGGNVNEIVHTYSPSVKPLFD
jgi:hypothetical protein